MTAIEQADDRALGEALAQALTDAPDTFDRASWRRLAESGWLHMLAGEGAEGPARELARQRTPMEQWGVALPAGPVLLNVAWLLPLVQITAADGIVDEVSSGRVYTASRHTSGATADPDLQAEVDGGTWRLSGSVRLVPWLPDADETFVTATTSDGRPLLAAVPTSGPGVRIQPSSTIDPGISVGDLELDQVPASVVIDADPAALETAAAIYSLALDAQAVGASGELLDQTVRYVSDRRQFGQPIGSFQAIKHRVADMLTATESARAMLWLAADQLAQQPLDPPWEEIDASRVFAGDAARKVAMEAIQCFGGMGFTWEQGLHLYYRRTLVAGSLLGDVEAAGRRLVRYGLSTTKERA